MARILSPLRTGVRRHPNLHAFLKLLRLLPQAAPGAWSDLGRTSSIFRVLPATMMPPRRLMNVYDCARQVELDGLDGSIVECGVWSGGGAALMALASEKAGGGSRPLHLFDSFEGLPPPSEKDLEVVDGFRRAHPDLALDDGRSGVLPATGACRGASVEGVQQLFARLEIRGDRTTFYTGWFQDTVPSAARHLGPIALLHLDGDLYESTRVCLQHLYHLVVPGGFVIIDDYGTFEGCSTAVDEFFDANPPPPHFADIDGEGVFFRKPGT